MKRLIGGGLALLVLWLSSGSTMAATSGVGELAAARGFVQALYDGYVRGDAPSPPGDSAPRVFAPTLLRLIRVDQARAQGEVGALDHDPLCACQDFALTRLRIQGHRRDRNQARFEVRFDNVGTPTRVDLDLVHLPGVGWLVQDVHNALTASLESFLRRALGASH
ncbi:MAG: hypothetical protein AMXMBFR78_00660 [Rubrivivax sp.]|nr:DUF3828 domain-containing protein [Rubrivivax sp.]